MYLNVILTIFVILQITTMVLLYKWWDKYGRRMVNSFLDMKSGFSNQMGGVKSPNLFEGIPDMNVMMKQLNDMTRKFK